MKTLNLFYLAFIIELSILAACFLFLLADELLYSFSNKRKRRVEEKLTAILMQEMLLKTRTSPLRVPHHLNRADSLLIVLESFNHRFKGSDWDAIKEEILTHFLIPYAKKWAHSFFWEKRLFTARCAALSPKLIDKKIILSLLEDSLFLVRAKAYTAATEVADLDVVHFLIKTICKTQGYERYLYKDLLTSCSTAVFQHIEKIAATAKDTQVYLMCLDLLSTRIFSIALFSLTELLQSTNREIRLAAVKILAHNTQKESYTILLSLIDDDNPLIRQHACYGLAGFPTEKSFHLLEQSLQDEKWPVRLQAAQSLRKMGEGGVHILEQQTKESNTHSYEVAQYALVFT